MRWPWSREGATDGHVDPDLERASAELYGRIDRLCDEVEQVVSERERALGLDPEESP